MSQSITSLMRAGAGSAPSVDRTPSPNGQNDFGPLGELSFDEIYKDLDYRGQDGDLTKMFQLQMKMNRETLFYTGMSNVVKTRHETAMNSVRNVKS